MRWSHALIPTLKETPADAVAPSHVLLLRAGMIRQLGAGTYTYMPLGLRVLHKAIRIVREEMDAAGALELLMPALQPVELWKESGRFEAYGDLLMKLTISGGHQMALGPTHEEVDHRHRPRPDPLVQAAPDHALPDPDQVPRRAAAPVRDRPDPRVPDEGRLQHRRRPRPAQLQLRQDVRGVLPDLRPLRAALRDRRGRERADRRRLVARVHGPLLDRRGHGDLLRQVRLRGQPGARRGRRPRPRRRARPTADAPAYQAVADARQADDPRGLRVPRGRGADLGQAAGLPGRRQAGRRAAAGRPRAQRGEVPPGRRRDGASSRPTRRRSRRPPAPRWASSGRWGSRSRW